MPDRTINWGDPSDPGTTYQTGDDDPAGGGNFVVARDTDGGVTLLEYDATAGEWVSRGDVNLDGNDLSANAIDAGSVSANALEADSATVNGTAGVVELLANTIAGADVANASENQILVTQGDGTLSVEAQAQGPNPYDQAQSFAESDVTITKTNTEIKNESIKLSPLSDDNVQLGDVIDDPVFSYNANDSQGVGVVVNPNTTLFGFEAQLAPDYAHSGKGANQFDLVDLSDGTILDSVDGSDKSAGDSITLVAEVSAGTEYNILPRSNDFDLAQDTDYNFPTQTGDFDAVRSEKEDGTNSDRWNTYDKITAITSAESTSGSAIIEWDRGIPEDIFEWDVATFTRTLDGETVDLFVAYSDDGGSTWQRTNSGNPITRNYSLNEDANITPDVDVRIETELSRADTANNPTLDSAYRSWLV